MPRRLGDALLALLLLSLAFPALAHAAAPLALSGLSLAAHTAGHHLRALLAACAVVAALRAVPHPSARLLELLLGAWAARLVLAGTAAA